MPTAAGGTMHRRLTYANVAATLALVFAMSGGALAASHYLINSTKQINPKVLKKLRGARGAAGAAGQRGATGAVGPTGKEGTPGKEGSPGLPASASIATAFAQTSASPIPVEGETETVVLNTKTSGKNLSLPGAGAHVLAEANVQVVNTEAPTAVELTCQLASEAIAAGVAHPFGNTATVALQGSFVTHTEIPLTGNVSLVGGETYALLIICHSKLFSDNGSVVSAAINAVGPE
jgi:hypothetical protein